MECCFYLASNDIKTKYQFQNNNCFVVNECQYSLPKNGGIIIYTILLYHVSTRLSPSCIQKQNGLHNNFIRKWTDILQQKFQSHDTYNNNDIAEHEDVDSRVRIL